MRAEADLLDIGAYTLRTWGEHQAARYLNSLEAWCQKLALGRRCDQVRTGLRRMEHGRHFIFREQATGGILVSRILHERMLPEWQIIDDEGSAGPPT